MYSLTEDHVAIQDLVRRVAREKVAPRADEIDRTRSTRRTCSSCSGTSVCSHCRCPAEHGGTGSLLAGCIAVEEFGRVCYNTGYLLVVQWVAFGALHAAGNAEQKARFLPGLATGELRGAFSTTEAQSGSDVSGHQDARDARRRRLSAERLEDLVHEFGRGRLRARRREVRRRRRQGQHQPVHRREGHAGLQRRPQGRQDGRARRAVVPAVLRRRLRPRSQPHGSGGRPGLQARHGGVQHEPPDRRGARRGPGARCDRSRDGVHSVAQGLRPPHRRLPGPALDARRHGDADRSRAPAHVQGRLDGRRRRHRARARHAWPRWPSASPPTSR